MGRAWMDTIARRPDTRVSAIVDVMPGAARSAADERRWGCARRDGCSSRHSLSGVPTCC